METASLKDKYGYMFADLAKYGKAASVIDETNVYQEANEFTRPLLNKMLEENLLPGSKIEGLENFKDFLAQIKDNNKFGLYPSNSFILNISFENTFLYSGNL